MASGRCLVELADRAWALFNQNDKPDKMVFLLRVEEAFRTLVHEGGGFYRQVAEIPLVVGRGEYPLPDDYRVLTAAPYLFYTPREIATVARVDNVLAVTTEVEHNLSPGLRIALEGTEGFDGVYVVEEADETAFSCISVGEDANAVGGSVVAVNGAEGLSLCEQREEEFWPLVPTQGWTARYRFTGAFNINLEPLPDGSCPALFLEYDAEAPAELSDLDPLPIPAYLEGGLLGYAGYMAGHYPLGMEEFQRTITTWRAARVQREQATARKAR